MDKRDEETAQEIRRLHLLNVALSASVATSQNDNHVRALDRAEQAIAKALSEARAQERQRCVKIARESQAEGERLRANTNPHEAHNLLRVSRTSWVNTARAIAAEIEAINDR